MAYLLGRAHWCEHANAVQPSPQLRAWLVDRGSMTFKLMARCEHFGVRRLCQHSARSLADERAALGLTLRQRVEERDVILYCDGRPVVFGHTVTPWGSVAAWPFFRRLGNRPLGASLFTDPLVVRAPLQFARLHVRHPLAQRIYRALNIQNLPHPLYARRSLFWRRGKVMLVTDIFLPAIRELMVIEQGMT